MPCSSLFRHFPNSQDTVWAGHKRSSWTSGDSGVPLAQLLSLSLSFSQFPFRSPLLSQSVPSPWLPCVWTVSSLTSHWWHFSSRMHLGMFFCTCFLTITQGSLFRCSPLWCLSHSLDSHFPPRFSLVFPGFQFTRAVMEHGTQGHRASPAVRWVKSFIHKVVMRLSHLHARSVQHDVLAVELRTLSTPILSLLSLFLLLLLLDTCNIRCFSFFYLCSLTYARPQPTRSPHCCSHQSGAGGILSVLSSHGSERRSSILLLWVVTTLVRSSDQCVVLGRTVSKPFPPGPPATLKTSPTTWCFGVYHINSVFSQSWWIHFLWSLLRHFSVTSFSPCLNVLCFP